MQNPTEDPRTAFTTAQIVDLIQGNSYTSSTLIVGKGLQLIDQGLNVLDDISQYLASGSQITRDAFAELHASCTLNLSTELDWGAAIVRPYTTLSNGVNTATFYMGAYYLSVPIRLFTTEPPVFSVTGFDILNMLDDPVGDAFTVPAGTLYTDAIENILQTRGYTMYNIDRTNTATLPANRVWAFDEQLTWLKIVNDMIAAIGYQGVWSDWNGMLQVRPYDSPLLRTPEWTYTFDSTTSIMSPVRQMDMDYYAAPNRWVFYQNNIGDGAAPVEGAGKYTFINQSAGNTSVDARGGRIISKVVGLDAADQPSLIAAATITIDADKSVTQTWEQNTSPNPLHWHFDRLVVTDPQLGSAVDMQSVYWIYDMDGADQQHKWQVLT